MITVEDVAERVSRGTGIPYSQCLATVKRRARQYGRKRVVSVYEARCIIDEEIRAARAPVQSHESLRVI